MLKCCICGRKIGVFGEDRYKITEEYITCYQCTSFIRGMKEAKNVDQIIKNENGLKEKMREYRVPLEVQKAIENELQKIKDLKQEIYNKEKIQVLQERKNQKKCNEFIN